MSKLSSFKSIPQATNFCGSYNQIYGNSIPNASNISKVASGFFPKLKETSGIISEPRFNSINTPLLKVENEKYPIIQDIRTDYFLHTNKIGPPNEPFIIKSQTLIPSTQPNELENFGNTSGPKIDDIDNPTQPKRKLKKERNRVSAQKCRARKKKYIESLENKIKELQNEIEQYKKENKILKEKQFENFEGKNVFKEYTKMHEELMKDLNKLIIEDRPEKEISELINKIKVTPILIVGKLRL